MRPLLNLLSHVQDLFLPSIYRHAWFQIVEWLMIPPMDIPRKSLWDSIRWIWRSPARVPRGISHAGVHHIIQWLVVLPGHILRHGIVRSLSRKLHAQPLQVLHHSFSTGNRVCDMRAAGQWFTGMLEFEQFIVLQMHMSIDCCLTFGTHNHFPSLITIDLPPA